MDNDGRRCTSPRNPYPTGEKQASSQPFSTCVHGRSSAVQLSFLSSHARRDDAVKTMDAHEQTWTQVNGNPSGLVPSGNMRLYGTDPPPSFTFRTMPYDSELTGMTVSGRFRDCGVQ